jgi:hypothetical protein
MVKMAVHYVDITKDDLENWLDSLGKKWTKDVTKAGIYYIHLSNTVAVKLSSTLSGTQTTMDYAKASMKLSLVSLVTKKLLNKKDADRSHFKRTTNWKTTWKEGVDHWESVYKNAKGFYDRISVVEDQEQYKENWLSKIESVQNWESVSILSQLHNKVQTGTILSPNQEGAILKFVKNVRSVPTPVVEESRTPVSSYKEEWLSKIEIVPNWEDIDFLSQVHDKVLRGVRLSPNQENAILKFVNNVKSRSRPVHVEQQRPVMQQRPVHVEQPATQVHFTPEQQRAMARLEALVEVASPVDSTFTLIMINKAKKGIKLSDEEKQKLIGLLRQYNIQ